MLKFLQKRKFHKILNSLVAQGDYKKALNHIEQAPEKYGFDEDVALYKVWLLLECNALQDDSNILYDLESKHPDHPIVLLLKGEYLFQQKHYPQAQATLEKSLRLDPHNLRTEYSLAKVCLALGEIDKATQLMKSTVQYDPKLVQSKLLALTELLLMKNTNQTS
ncbi:MAG TPA: tetratricopeptide repeat protein [Oligoflexia bacterium]|nr:tetratricopeptide repeat protein [Oligoflexia bacterium]HMR23961.1 tetratricopeptide repeat protein [Oligoflexia bacterium]